MCGANGSGKSNLSRSLELIAAVAPGELAAVFWAGPERITAAMRRGCGWSESWGPRCCRGRRCWSGLPGAGRPEGDMEKAGRFT